MSNYITDQRKATAERHTRLTQAHECVKAALVTINETPTKTVREGDLRPWFQAVIMLEKAEATMAQLLQPNHVNLT